MRIIVFGLLLALVGCGPESSKTVPDDLMGVWKTSDPKYADTFIELTRTTIVFGFADGTADVRTVASVEKVREDGNLLYTVFYVDPEQQQYKLSFYYEAAGGVMRWKNQRTIAWMKAKQ
jgi:hypothetical protein